MGELTNKFAKAGMNQQKTIHLSCSSTGIGDAILGFYVALFLSKKVAEHGIKVKYWSRAFEWLKPLELDGVDTQINNIVIAPYKANVGTDVFKGYNKEFKGSYEFRLERYLNNAKRLFNTPSTKRTPQIYNRKIAYLNDAPNYSSGYPFPPAFKDYILIAPFATYKERQWPMANFAHLARTLVEQGEKVAFVCSLNDAKRMQDTFSGMPCKAFIGKLPAELIHRMAHCKAIITNDSGLAHVGNLYQVPTYVIMAHLPFDFVFDVFTRAKTTVGIVPYTFCSPCFFQAPLHKPECNRLGCSSLNSISVDQVFNDIKL